MNGPNIENLERASEISGWSDDELQEHYRHKHVEELPPRFDSDEEAAAWDAGVPLQGEL